MTSYKDLFKELYPGFFDDEEIRSLPENEIYEEMLLELEAFGEMIYTKEFGPEVSFGIFEGDLEELRKAVGLVDPAWPKYFQANETIFCAYVGGQIASFCIVEDFGTHVLNGRTVRIGGPGCVGTLPQYRNRGMGLVMVAKVTGLLKERGFDYSYIHYTGVGRWYEKLGYRTVVRWGSRGLL